jgi:hypothetical protein
VIVAGDEVVFVMEQFAVMADFHAIELLVVAGVDGVNRALLHLVHHIFILILARPVPVLENVLEAQVLSLLEMYVLADEAVSGLAGSIVVLEERVLPQLIYARELLLADDEGLDAHGLLEVEMELDLPFLPLHAVEFGH